MDSKTVKGHPQNPFKNFIMQRNGRTQTRGVSLQNRKAHFLLGHSGDDFNSSYRQWYNSEQNNSFSNSNTNSEFIKKTNFTMGQNKTLYDSLYSSNFSPSNGSRVKKNNQGLSKFRTDIELGFHPAKKVSEQSCSFTRQNGKPNSLPPEREKDLRSSHFKLGTGQNNYRTVYGLYGTAKGEVRTEGFSMISDMRATHFQVGNDPNEYTTVNQQQFFKKPTTAPGSGWQPKFSSIQFGNDRKQFRSMYRSTFSYH